MLSSVTEHIQAWITAKIPWWLLSEASITQYFPNIIITVLVWLVLHGVAGVVSEYTKRFWFGHIHRDKISKNMLATEQGLKATESMEAEFDAISPDIATLIKALDEGHKNFAALQKRNKFLEEEYSLLLEENAKLRNLLPV